MASGRGPGEIPVGSATKLDLNFVSIRSKQIMNCNRAFSCLVHGHLSLGEIDLSAVDLAVQEEGVRSQDQRCDGEDDCEGSRGGTARNAGSTGHRCDSTRGLVQRGEDLVDVVTSRCVGVVRVQSRLTLGSHFVRFLADSVDFVVLVVVVVLSVVVSIVSVVLVLVFVDLFAIDAGTVRNDGLAGERERTTVVECSVDVCTGGHGATGIVESVHVDRFSVLG